MHEGEPAISFSIVEISQAEALFNSIVYWALVAKFSAGRPSVYAIKDHISNHRGLSSQFTVGPIDPRHVIEEESTSWRNRIMNPVLFK